jgi:transketolase
MAESRSLRAFRRTRINASLFDADLTGVKAVDSDYEIVGKPSVSLDDIKTFRQLDSRCPGHPEYHWTSGVETTTGPLGQGVATVSAWRLRTSYNRPGFELFNGDCMRGAATVA